MTLTSAANATLRFEAGDDIVFQGTGNVVTTGGGSHTVELVADLENNVVEDGGTVTQDTAATVSVTTNNLAISRGRASAPRPPGFTSTWTAWDYRQHPGQPVPP